MCRLGCPVSLLLVVTCVLPLGSTALGDPDTRGLARVTMPAASPHSSEPPQAADSLTLAADCLSRGDNAGAADYLSRHVVHHPDQLVFRAQLAEVLARLDRLPEAQAQFEAATACAQDGTLAARNRLVHYHTRLMEIARLRGDDYAENLNRGIGLYLVALQLAKKGNAGDVERLLCKAAGALKEAQSRRPDDARPAWYLYRVWSRLDQPHPAERSLRKAIANAPFSDLTPAEARDLSLAPHLGIPSK